MERLSPEKAYQKIQRYCAYQERSHLEVKQKLYSFGLFRAEVEDIITQLITDGFLNEERFAKAYAGGKFRMKKWGRIKIVKGLEEKGVSKNCIRIGIKEIDEQDYQQTLRHLVEEKFRKLEGDNLFARRDHAAHFAIQKGYEPDLVWEVAKSLKS